MGSPGLSGEEWAAQKAGFVFAALETADFVALSHSPHAVPVDISYCGCLRLNCRLARTAALFLKC